MAPCEDVLCFSAVSLLDSVIVALCSVAKNSQYRNIIEKWGCLCRYIRKKDVVKAKARSDNGLDPFFYFLIWEVPDTAAGLLPALRTGTFETGILVRGGSLARGIWEAV